MRDWQAALADAGMAAEAVTFAHAAVGARLGTDPDSMDFLSPSSVFVVAMRI